MQHRSNSEVWQFFSPDFDAKHADSNMLKRREPTVMNESFLQKVIEAQFISSLAPIPEFNEVLILRLDFEDILHIEHLWDFTSLTRLDLNGNLIEKIQGLDFLTNLTWLNLSYNRIKKIEGLQALQKLEMLNLANNKICVIENLDALENLTHFIFANNLVDQLDNVLCLRKFKKLFAINLSGNPICDSDGYRFYIAVYFPNLMSLDCCFLDEETRNKASDKYSYVLEKMKQEEEEKQKADEAKRHQEAELKLHKDAFVENLNGSCLFKSMFEGDPEAETLHQAPEVASLIQTFEHQMVELCTQLFETGLAEHERREAEMKCFHSGQSEAVKYHRQKQSQMLEMFDKEHRKRIAELHHLSDPEIIAVKINHGSDQINNLCKGLMTLEFQLVRQVEENIKTFDNSISEMVANFTETAQGIFVQCRDLEDNYYQKVREVVLATLAKVASETLDEELPDDVLTLFTDKDTVLDALTTGHDKHLLKINDQETQLVTRASAWRATLIKEIQDKELHLNRTQLSDIHKYMDHLREQLEEFQ